MIIHTLAIMRFCSRERRKADAITQLSFLFSLVFFVYADDARACVCIYVHSRLRKLLTLRTTTAKIACREKKKGRRKMLIGEIEWWRDEGNDQLDQRPYVFI